MPKKKQDQAAVPVVMPGELRVQPATVVTPQDVPAGKPDLAKAGINLAQWVLVILAGFIVIAIAVLIWEEERNLSLMENGYSQLMANDVNAEAKETAKEVMLQFDAQRKTFREYWMQFSQMILLNLLLPVLTAILGYVFGRAEVATSD
ncbi:MAG TPA: hypothetical protein VJ785_09605 [Anaerolineales bacterium]|nr:hypothetical protein [Anaerolineales bacterium]